MIMKLALLLGYTAAALGMSMPTKDAPPVRATTFSSVPVEPVATKMGPVVPTPAPTPDFTDGPVTYDFKWFPSATYDENALDGDTDKWWRCGSGGYLMTDDGNYCEGARDAGPVNLDDVGDSCQTMGDLGSRQTGDNSIFFAAKQDGKVVSEVTGGGKTYFPVLVLFSESDYCTGPFEEFYGQDDSYTPLTLPPAKKAPGAYYIKAWRVYFKPKEGNNGEPGTLGIKTVFFPYFYMAAYDETICQNCGDPRGLCEGKFLYKPFPYEDKGWPGLDCVSADDRVNCLKRDNDPKRYGTVQGDASGNNAYGCIDFAGCYICNVPGNQDACLAQKQCGQDENGIVRFDNKQDYCQGSPVTAANAYPLGSFYYNLYFQTKGGLGNGYTYCGDSVSNDGGQNFEVCTKGTDLYNRYAGYCVASRFYNCQDAVTCSAPYVCPDSADTYPFTYSSTSIEDLCTQRSGVCYNTGTGGDPSEIGIPCGRMATFDGTTSTLSNDYPLKTTCYITRIVKCDEVLGKWG